MGSRRPPLAPAITAIAFGSLLVVTGLPSLVVAVRRARLSASLEGADASPFFALLEKMYWATIAESTLQVLAAITAVVAAAFYLARIERPAASRSRSRRTLSVAALAVAVIAVGQILEDLYFWHRMWGLAAIEVTDLAVSLVWYGAKIAVFGWIAARTWRPQLPSSRSIQPGAYDEA